MTLQEILGGELWEQVQAKIEESNAGNDDKRSHNRFANLADGGYVSKDKHTALESELGSAKKLIEELKASKQDDETLQQQIATYESEIQQLKEQNNALRMETALKIALAEKGGVDVDYLMYKAKEKGNISISDEGDVRGVDDTITSLRTMYPNMFQGGVGGAKKIVENPLPQSKSDSNGVTKEQFEKMGYQERLKLYGDNPDLYQELTK